MSLQTIDFTKCFFCQSEDVDDLKSPEDQKVSKSKEHDNVNPYSNLSQLILQFHQLKQFPFDHDIDHLNSLPGGLSNLLKINRAKYHKNCRSNFNQTKLQRAQKRSSTDSVPVPPKTRASTSTILPKSGSDKNTIPVCIFCDEPGNHKHKLHPSSTFDLDKKVRGYVNMVGDEELLRKLSPGDLIAIDADYHLNCLVNLYNRGRSTK